MSRYQITRSIICFLAAATGMVALAQKVAIGSAPEAWGLFCLLTCLALVMVNVIGRRPMTHEAIFRVAGVESWSELSAVRRYCLMLFDWPLYWEIRDREARRLLDEPLVRIFFQGSSVRLQPIEIQHKTRFFLRQITSVASQHDLQVQSRQGTAEVWSGKADPRIMQHIREAFADGDLISLGSFAKAVEHGFIDTLPEKDRYAYMRAMR